MKLYYCDLELDEQAEGEICIGILVEWLRERLYTELQHIDSAVSESDESLQGKSLKQQEGRYGTNKYHFFYYRN